MKIYRSILLNEGDKVDRENVGISWTLCEIFAEDHAKDINRGVKKDGFVIISAEITEENIDFDNTLFALENRDYEYEVVLLPCELKCEVSYVESVEHIEEGETFFGTSGSNSFEDYCDDYEGELTKKDFFEIANQF